MKTWPWHEKHRNINNLWKSYDKHDVTSSWLWLVEDCFSSRWSCRQKNQEWHRQIQRNDIASCLGADSPQGWKNFLKNNCQVAMLGFTMARTKSWTRKAKMNTSLIFEATGVPRKLCHDFSAIQKKTTPPKDSWRLANAFQAGQDSENLFHSVFDLHDFCFSKYIHKEGPTVSCLHLHHRRWQIPPKTSHKPT